MAYTLANSDQGLARVAAPDIALNMTPDLVTVSAALAGTVVDVIGRSLLDYPGKDLGQVLHNKRITL